MNLLRSTGTLLVVLSISASSINAEEYSWDFAAANAAESSFVVPGTATDLKALSEIGYQVVAGKSASKVLAISGDQSEALKSVTKLPATINTRVEARLFPLATPNGTVMSGGAWALSHAEKRGFVLTVWTQEEPLDGKIKYAEVAVPAPTGDWYDVVCEITQTEVSLTVNDAKASLSLTAPPKDYASALLVAANRPSLSGGTGGWRPFIGSIAKLTLKFQ